jgi:3-hydroxyacyl-CoA dehydrogenase/enoyl-CoA hydratase/3-hydroxybutyryl-CoA epimerase
MSETAIVIPTILSLAVDPEGIATLTIDQPGSKVNVLNQQLSEELAAQLPQIRQRRELRGLIIASAKSKQFIAGADIGMIKGVQSIEQGRQISRQAQKLLSDLESLPFPVVTAINGNCLGGGLEVALAATYRICADDNYQIGLPEVQLGLLPGAGGTQRLPRLIGLTSALDMILSGRRLRPARALKAGVVDEVVPPGRLLERARQALLELIEHRGPAAEKVRQRSRSGAAQFLEKVAARSFLQAKVSKDLQKKTRGHYPAPFKALEAVLASVKSHEAQGYELEAELFGECACTSVSKGLIHVYEITTSNRAKSDERAAAHPFEPKSIGVLGAGLMGSGIATVLAAQGYNIRVKDMRLESLGKCVAYADRVYTKELERKRIRPFEKAQRLHRISTTTSYQGFQQADIVIEAVFEDMQIKQSVLKDVEANCKPNTIFATNTSSLPIGEIAKAAARPENVIGMHFFSPVDKMQLVEVIVTPQTAEWVTAATVALGKKMNTHVVVVGDGPGFYTTRALAAYLAQAILLFMDGAHADQIDDALVELGFPVGPMLLMDEVGLDVAHKVVKVMTEYLPERFSIPERWQGLLSDGRQGKRDGRGFYLYKGKTREPDPELHDKASQGNPPRVISTREIQDRCLFAFLCESLHCLKEGVLRSKDDGDLAAIFGLGFPPFLGGPFHFMETTGATEVERKLKELAIRHGKTFLPPAT